MNFKNIWKSIKIKAAQFANWSGISRKSGKDLAALWVDSGFASTPSYLSRDERVEWAYRMRPARWWNNNPSHMWDKLDKRGVAL